MLAKQVVNEEHRRNKILYKQISKNLAVSVFNVLELYKLGNR